MRVRLPHRRAATQKLMHSGARNHQVLGVNRGVESASRQEELKPGLPPDQRQKHRLMESSIESRALA